MKEDKPPGSSVRKGKALVYGHPSPGTPDTPSPSLDQTQDGYGDDDESAIAASPHPIQHLQQQQSPPPQGQQHQYALVPATPAKQVVAAPVAAATPAVVGDDDYYPLIPYNQQRWITFWVYSSATSVAVFVLIVLPWTALVALMVGMASTAALVRSAVSAIEQDVTPERVLVWLLHNNYLPIWLNRALTETSLHDWLSPDPDVDWNRIWNENRHLLLYFLPVQHDRLEGLMNRLPPRHSRQLHRPGFLGRALLGDQVPPPPPSPNVQGSAATTPQRRPAIPAIVGQQQPQQEPSPLTTTAATTGASRRRRRLDLDEDSVESDLGLDLSPNDLAGGLTDGQATRMASSLGLNSNAVTNAAVAATPLRQQEQQPPPPSSSVTSSQDSSTSATATTMNEDEEYALEESLLTEAFVDILYAFCLPICRGTWRDWVVDGWIRPAARMLYRVGGSLSVTATGMGALGYYQRNYAPYLQVGGRSSRSGFPGFLFADNGSWVITQVTSPRVVWTTAILGAGTLGVAWVAQSLLVGSQPRPSSQSERQQRRRSSVQSSSSSKQPKDSDKDKAKKD